MDRPVLGRLELGYRLHIDRRHRWSGRRIGSETELQFRVLPPNIVVCPWTCNCIAPLLQLGCDAVQDMVYCDVGSCHAGAWPVVD